MPPIGLRIDTSQNQLWGISPRGASRDPTEVVPNLFLGSCSVGNNKARLQEHGIKAVLDASMSTHQPHGPDIEYFKVNVEDLPDADLLTHFPACCEFIRNQLQASVKPTLKEAYDHVITRKPNVYPNEGFFRQLQAMEQQLTGKVTMGILDYYKHSFVKMGYPRQQVEHVLETSGTTDYNRLVTILHSRGSRPNSAVSALSSGHSSMDM